MRRETAACFHRSGEVVVLFGYIRGSVLESAGHKANQFWRIRCYESGGCESGELPGPRLSENVAECIRHAKSLAIVGRPIFERQML
jgi:hypothetical protein